MEMALKERMPNYIMHLTAAIFKTATLLYCIHQQKPSSPFFVESDVYDTINYINSQELNWTEPPSSTGIAYSSLKQPVN